MWCALALIVLASVLVLATVSARTSTHEARRLSGQLHVSSANALLASQQLEDIFLEMTQAGFFEGQLSEPLRRTLRTWAQYDRQFLNQNQDNPGLRVERATTRRRLGYTLHALQQYHESAEHLRRALRLLADLGRENPVAFCYQDEAADTWYQLGRTLQALQKPAESAVAMRKAMQILRDDLTRYLPAGERLLRLALVYEELAALADERADFEQASDYLSDAVTVRRHLCGEFPDDVRLARGLAESCVALQNLRQRAGRLAEAAEVGPDGLSLLEGLAARFPDDERLRKAVAHLRNQQNRPESNP